MLRSNLISMLSGSNQMSTTTFTIAYSYTTAGLHTASGVDEAEAAMVQFYGINNTGSVLLATGYMITDTAYTAGDEAAVTMTGIPARNDFPYMRYEILPAGSFSRIEGQPQIGLSVTESVSNLSDDIREPVTVVYI